MRRVSSNTLLHRTHEDCYSFVGFWRERADVDFLLEVLLLVDAAKRCEVVSSFTSFEESGVDDRCFLLVCCLLYSCAN